MPDNDPDYAVQALVIERDLRALKRSIVAVVQRGQAALDDENKESLFEAHLSTALDDWQEFRNAWNQFTSLQLRLGKKDFPDEQWQAFYDQTREELVKGKSILLNIQKRKNVSPPVPQDTSFQNVTLSSNSRSNLPKIQLPHFSGDLIKWTHFKDTFKSMVHEDPNISNIERFHYLLAALRGEASSLLSGIPVDGNSYPLAWNKLMKEYDRPRILASLFLQRMVDFDIRKFKNEAEQYDSYIAYIADSVDGFKALKLENPGEFILAFLALRGLDSSSRKEFEIALDSPEVIPTPEDVIEFVRKRRSAHKFSNDFSCKSSHGETNPRNQFLRRDTPSRFSFKYSRPKGHQVKSSDHREPHNSKSYYTLPSEEAQVQTKIPCPLCGGQHLLSYCIKFERLPTEERLSFIEGWKGCRNCLRGTHTTPQCTSKWRCRFCKQNHHSMLHTEEGTHHAKVSPKPSAQKQKPSTKQDNVFTGFGATPSSSGPHKIALLGTIQGVIKGPRNGLFPFRAVLDSGSQRTFISQSLARKIGVQIRQGTGFITGLGGVTVSNPTGSVRCVLRPFKEDIEFTTEALVVESISAPLPSSPIGEDMVTNLLNLQLADPSFHQPGPIDILIGMDLYPLIMNGPIYHSAIEDLYLQPTSFGLVVIGSHSAGAEPQDTTLFNDSRYAIQEHLKKFWELEEPTAVERVSPEDKYCEEHFIQTHSRNSEGRYVVKLPRITGCESVGNNVDDVTKRFFGLEKRLCNDHEMAGKYKQFMQEYLDLKHMTLATAKSNYLIPHHSVWQHKPGGKKLRVVFDASCPSSTRSLNDILLSGPKLQKNLGNILIRFRLFVVPLCADLVKMYRQVLVHDDDLILQHILWRSDPKDAIHEFQLNTLTYGVRPSAFLAMRVIKQLVVDEGVKYPHAVESINNSMYVDDLVTGADSVEEAIILQRELVQLFAKGGFSLSKWASTAAELIPDEDKFVEQVTLTEPDCDYIKILGLVWNPLSDQFSYNVIQPPARSVTKRMILSAIARIFDPLGMLSPVILYVKVLLQEVWKNRLDWDDKLTPEIAERWGSVADQWNILSTVTFPRHISGTYNSYMLVGFCDASSVGYAASIYLRSESQEGTVHSALVLSKSKVAPLKYTSIARLELCGALLLARLMSSIDIPALKNRQPRCFTDSSVVLGWLNTPCHYLKVFEANRVSTILEVVPLTFWGHVRSEDNPSDLASRGCLPEYLRDNQLWWHGPQWLLQPLSQWPKPPEASFSAVTFIPPKTTGEASSVRDSPETWMTRFSNFSLLIRTIARILRWQNRSHCKNKMPFPEHIGVEEFNYAKEKCVKLIQQYHLPKQMFDPTEAIPKKQHTYTNMSPFLDETGIVRVGGRLHESPLAYQNKHPILLPRNSHFTKLIVDDIHHKHFHSGPSLTLALLRMQWWIPGAMKFIKGRILRCVKCRIHRAKPLYPQMAPLPKSRFADTHAFHHTGLDYAGPFIVRHSARRNAPTDKAYLAIFVCMATKAVHLEAVSALSTVALLAALDRFFARRGLPKEIWSDHGTNFIGASRYLKDVYKFILNNDENIAHQLAPKGVQWKFIPPRAPHFGGLWEAGVKSVKTLLPKTIGSQPFTFEELSTALARIEGILNSRPLCALYEDPESSDFLTPGHFLIGAPILNYPEQPEFDPNLSSTSRWKLVQSRVALTWNRWRREYLHTLQTRTKWSRGSRDMRVGDLVIMVEKRSAIGQWPVARIVEVYPGKDGIVRTVSVKTPAGKTFMRPSTSLVYLFHDED